MAGPMRTRVQIWEVATGSCIMQVTPSGAWAGLQPDQWSRLWVWQVCWGGERHSQLHVACACQLGSSDDGTTEPTALGVLQAVLLAVLQF